MRHRVVIEFDSSEWRDSGELAKPSKADEFIVADITEAVVKHCREQGRRGVGVAHYFERTSTVLWAEPPKTRRQLEAEGPT